VSLEPPITQPDRPKKRGGGKLLPPPILKNRMRVSGAFLKATPSNLQ